MPLHAQPTTAIPVGHYTPGTPEWYEARKTRLGGSEIAAVLGLSPYESHLSLWLRKQGLAPQKPPNPDMEWGNRLEPAVLGKFAETRPGWHSLGSAGSFVHIERPWQLSSPDGLHDHGHEIVEAKTAHHTLDWGDPPDGEIPVGYRCQALWNMNVMGARRCWVPVLIRGSDYREYLIEWDATAEAELAVLLDHGQRFIQSLASNDPPPIDGHDETYKIIRAADPDIEPGEVVIDAELREEYIATVIRARETFTARQKAAGEIMIAMGKLRNAIDERGQRFAFRKRNGEHDPFLCPDDALIKERRGAKTILGAVS